MGGALERVQIFKFVIFTLYCIGLAKQTGNTHRTNTKMDSRIDDYCFTVDILRAATFLFVVCYRLCCTLDSVLNSSLTANQWLQD